MKTTEGDTAANTSAGVGIVNVVGTAVVAIVGVTLVTCAVSVATSSRNASKSTVSEAPPHADATSRTVTSNPTRFTALVCHPSPEGGVGDLLPSRRCEIVGLTRVEVKP